MKFKYDGWVHFNKPTIFMYIAWFMVLILGGCFILGSISVFLEPRYFASIILIIIGVGILIFSRNLLLYPFKIHNQLPIFRKKWDYFFNLFDDNEMESLSNRIQKDLKTEIVENIDRTTFIMGRSRRITHKLSKEGDRLHLILANENSLFTDVEGDVEKFVPVIDKYLKKKSTNPDYKKN
jgi:hypothetical protein